MVIILSYLDTVAIVAIRVKGEAKFFVASFDNVDYLVFVTWLEASDAHRLIDFGIRATWNEI